MKKLKFFAGAILAAMALTVYVSAGTTQADAGVFFSQIEALSGCEAYLDCPNGTKITCEGIGALAVCGSGIEDGKPGVVCVSSDHSRDESYCD